MFEDCDTCGRQRYVGRYRSERDEYGLCWGCWKKVLKLRADRRNRPFYLDWKAELRHAKESANG